VPVRSVGRQYAHATACAALIMTRTSPSKLPQHDNVVRIADNRATGDCTWPSISCSKYYIRYVLGPAWRGSAPLYVPPWAIKGEAHNVTGDRLKLTQTHLDPAQAHKLSSSIHHIVE
jgi:hypothetical protein